MAIKRVNPEIWSPLNAAKRKADLRLANMQQALQKTTFSIVTTCMGGHIIQKWYEFTIGDREHDRYGRDYRLVIENDDRYGRDSRLVIENDDRYGPKRD